MSQLGKCGSLVGGAAPCKNVCSHLLQGMPRASGRVLTLPLPGFVDSGK